MAAPDKDEIAREAAAALTSDENILAVAICPHRDVDDRPREILVVVAKVPLDLDGYGRKLVKWRDSTAILSHCTPRWLQTAIQDEAGCWIISGKVLYSKTVHDPSEMLLELRKVVNSIPIERRMAALDKMMDEARMFPAIILRRGPSVTDASERTLLRDNPALARALFLLNGRPPRCEGTMLDDLLDLERLPPGIGEVTEIIRGLDRYDLKRFDQARKKYEALLKGLELMTGRVR